MDADLGAFAGGVKGHVRLAAVASALQLGRGDAVQLIPGLWLLAYGAGVAAGAFAVAEDLRTSGFLAELVAITSL